MDKEERGGKGQGMGKGKEVEEEWLGLDVGKDEGDEDWENWWRVWDVGADCKEIGGMECYGEPKVHPSLSSHR